MKFHACLCRLYRPPVLSPYKRNNDIPRSSLLAIVDTFKGLKMGLRPIYTA